MSASDNHTYEISHQMLAQLQLLIQSGTPLENIADILDAGKTASERTTKMHPEPDAQEIAVAALDLSRLQANTEALKATVDALLDSDDVKDVPSLAGSLDLISHAANAVLDEVTQLEAGATDQKPNLNTERRPAALDEMVINKTPHQLTKRHLKAKSEIADAPSPSGLALAGSPPRAAQFVTGSPDKVVASDTLVDSSLTKLAPEAVVQASIPSSVRPNGEPLELQEEPLVLSGPTLHKRLSGVLDQISSLTRDTGVDQNKPL